MEKATINITGMTCNHCVMRVEKALKALEGVSDATVSLVGKNAVVSFDENALDLEDIKDTIADAGYTVTG